MQTLATVGAVCLLVGGGMGFWLGDGMEAGRCAAREHDVAIQYAANGNERIEDARRALDVQHRRALQRAQRDAASEAVRVKESADYEVLIARAARPECSRDPDAFERLQSAIRQANARAADPTAGVRQDVRADPGADRAQ